MFNLFEGDGERAQRENNEAQAEASKANALDHLAHDVIGKSFRSDEFNKAFDATRDFKSGQDAGKEAGFFGQLAHDLTKDSNSKAHNDGFANGVDNKPSASSGSGSPSSVGTPSSPGPSSAPIHSASSVSDSGYDGGGSSYDAAGSSYGGTSRSAANSRQTKPEMGMNVWQGAWMLVCLPFRAAGMFLLLLFAYPVPTIGGCVVLAFIINGLLQTSRPGTGSSPAAVYDGGTSQAMSGEHFPQTRTGYLTASTIGGWSYSGVRYALNEMYARDGYEFKRGPIRHQFQKFSWYHPVPGRTSANIEANFTPIEAANQRLLAQRRNALTRAGQAMK